MKEFLRKEPALIFMGVRFVLMLIAATSLGAWINEDIIEQVSMLLAAILAIDVGTTVATRSNVYSKASVEDIATSATANVPPEPAATKAGEYVVSVVKLMLPVPALPMGLKVVSDLVVSYGNAQLTPEKRKEIQRKVHIRLRQAGLLRGRDFTPTSLLAIPLLLLLLAACAPVSQFATGGLNELAGDSAVLQWTDTGIVFHPGDAPAVDASLDILGTDLVLGTVEGQSADDCVADEVGVVCLFSVVEEPVNVNLVQGFGVTATVAYRRTPEGRPYIEFLTD